jgi:hypothetical protein
VTLEPWSVELSRSVTVMLALDGCYLWRCKSERKTTTMSAKVSLCETSRGRYLGFYVSVYLYSTIYTAFLDWVMGF